MPTGTKASFCLLRHPIRLYYSSQLLVNGELYSLSLCTDLVYILRPFNNQSEAMALSINRVGYDERLAAVGDILGGLGLQVRCKLWR